MELHTPHERVVGDRAVVSRALSQRLTIGLTRAAHIHVIDRGEGQLLDGIDLDKTAAHGIPPAHPDLVARPQPHRHGDLASQDTLAQLWTELNGRQKSPRLKEGGSGRIGSGMPVAAVGPRVLTPLCSHVRPRRRFPGFQGGHARRSSYHRCSFLLLTGEADPTARTGGAT